MSSVKFEKRAAQVEHKNTINNLRAQHKNEQENIKNKQTQTIQEMKHSNRVQIDDARIEHKKKYMDELSRQEATLEKLKGSLDQVKDQTNKEMAQLRQTNSEKKEAEATLFEADYNAKKNKHQMQLQDLDHEANVNLQRMQRQQKTQQEEIARDSGVEKRQLRESHLTYINMKKDEYAQKKLGQEGKFETSLRQQKNEHTNVLATNEREHLKKMEMDNKNFSQKHKNIEKTGKARTLEIQNRYEKRYENIHNANEQQLQTLGKRKEDIVNQVKAMLKKDVKLSLEKDQDPFYQNVHLSPRLSENEARDGYTVKIPVPKYDADKVKVNASGREIRVSMDRDYSFTHKNENGSSKISKTETSMQKMAVDKIIDPSKIERSYDEKNGELTFKIGLS